jgi:hypothetical protein
MYHNNTILVQEAVKVKVARGTGRDKSTGQVVADRGQTERDIHGNTPSKSVMHRTPSTPAPRVAPLVSPRRRQGETHRWEESVDVGYPAVPPTDPAARVTDVSLVRRSQCWQSRRTGLIVYPKGQKEKEPEPARLRNQSQYPFCAAETQVGAYRRYAPTLIDLDQSGLTKPLL